MWGYMDVVVTTHPEMPRGIFWPSKGGVRNKHSGLGGNRDILTSVFLGLQR